MARFERSSSSRPPRDSSRAPRDSSRDSRPQRESRFGSSRGDARGGRTFEGSQSFGRRDSSRDSGRGGPKRFGGPRRETEMTNVICSSCGKDCQVPFRPTSNKPIFCDDCFSKNSGKEKSGSSAPSNKDFDIINEKLNKIMLALNIKQ